MRVHTSLALAIAMSVGLALGAHAQVVGLGGSNRSLVFHSIPKGASVFFGDTYLGRADDPQHPASIRIVENSPPQMFTFSLTMEGYQPRDQKVSSAVLSPNSVYQVDPVQMLPATVGVLLLDTMRTFEVPLLALLGALFISLGLYLHKRRKAGLEQAQQQLRMELITGDAAESTMPSMVGRRLGQYMVIDELGRGGMAVVYQALPADTMDEKEAVAIKVVKEDRLADPESRARFEREVRIGAKLSHPNIVRLLDWGTAGPYYLVMELIDGYPLRYLVREDGMSPSEALHLLRPVFEAMAYAHSMGVWHRDLKPENIFVNNKDGRLTVMDFGISRQATDATVTSTDQMPVTPGYMSPEQFSAKNVAAASDQYSLAIIVWEMIAGHRPFEDASPLVVVLKHVQSPLPSLRAERSQVSQAFEIALNRMLAKNPADRFPDLAQAYTALERGAMPVQR